MQIAESHLYSSGPCRDDRNRTTWNSCVDPEDVGPGQLNLTGMLHSDAKDVKDDPTQWGKAASSVPVAKSDTSSLGEVLCSPLLSHLDQCLGLLAHIDRADKSLGTNIHTPHVSPRSISRLTRCGEEAPFMSVWKSAAELYGYIQ